MRMLRTLSPALLALALPAAAVEHLVVLQGHDFVPAVLTIEAGDSVRWTNESPEAHNVRADDNSFRCASTCRGDSSEDGYPTNPSGGTPSAAAWSYVRTFNLPGEVPYYCEAHGLPGGVGMAGRLTVVAADPPAGMAINVGHSGSWFNPVTNGQGFLLDVVAGNDPPLLALAWFTFGTSAGGVETQRWYTGLGSFEDGEDSVQLTLYRSTGGVIDQADPAVTTVAVGTATMHFEDCIKGSFSYELDLGGGTLANDIPIQRLTPPDLCEAMAATDN